MLPFTSCIRVHWLPEYSTFFFSFKETFIIGGIWKKKKGLCLGMRHVYLYHVQLWILPTGYYALWIFEILQILEGSRGKAKHVANKVLSAPPPTFNVWMATHFFIRSIRFGFAFPMIRSKFTLIKIDYYLSSVIWIHHFQSIFVMLSSGLFVTMIFRIHFSTFKVEHRVNIYSPAHFRPGQARPDSHMVKCELKSIDFPLWVVITLSFCSKFIENIATCSWYF